MKKLRIVFLVKSFHLCSFWMSKCYGRSPTIRGASHQVGDVLERFTNGYLRATPHRVLLTPHARNSIIRFNAVAAETVVEPLPQFVSEARPAAYTPVRMRTHMETTMRNLEKGVGAWDAETQTSKTATYVYDAP